MRPCGVFLLSSVLQAAQQVVLQVRRWLSSLVGGCVVGVALLRFAFEAED